MTDDTLADIHVDSTTRFKILLSQLVERAVKTDVDVRGTWEFATQGSIHNWEVEIIELDKQFGDHSTTDEGPPDEAYDGAGDDISADE